jgi:hypothetical protein
VELKRLRKKLKLDSLKNFAKDITRNSLSDIDKSSKVQGKNSSIALDEYANRLK